MRLVGMALERRSPGPRVSTGVREPSEDDEMRHLRPVGKRIPPMAQGDMVCDVCVAFKRKNPMTDEVEARVTCEKKNACDMG